MKRVLYLGLLALLTFSVITGCSSISMEEKQQDTPKQTQAEASVKKELSPMEVLMKSNEAMNKLKGLAYDIDAENTLNTGDIKMNVKMNMSVKEKQEPFMMHGKGNVTVLGMEMPMEFYETEKYSYFKMGKEKWQKEPVDHSQVEKPDDSLKEIEAFMKAASDPKATKMTKNNGVYLLSLDLQKDQPLKGELLNIIEDDLKDLLEDEGTDQSGKTPDMKELENKMKLDKLKLKVEVDEKTFELKKLYLNYGIKVSEGKRNLKMGMKISMDIKGHFEGDIKLPAELKNK
ncbi:hypothetical protein SAMN05421852_11080 [Thermoflavimicrobium dichotomicum]|uniref:Lipoprotein n=2 Tax=Thermoflavimicrobium dichotomicum TaxID=46223 RepID=A0A1I3RNR9_9BACL|nr:hypothetical protein SAMN05421852_11080 [Thermoflavimicrobium dichotomicum]